MLIRPATPADAPDIDTLLDAAFGPGRHARTASRLRAGAVPLSGPSLVSTKTDGELLGSIQLWPIALVTNETAMPLTLLGPVAVAASARAIGLGRLLLAKSLAVADDLAIDPILLIGDASYYGPFGFAADRTGGWSLPGPVERERLLLRQRSGRSLPLSGHVVAADSVVAGPRAMVAVDG